MSRRDFDPAYAKLYGRDDARSAPLSAPQPASKSAPLSSSSSSSFSLEDLVARARGGGAARKADEPSLLAAATSGGSAYRRAGPSADAPSSRSRWLDDDAPFGKHSATASALPDDSAVPVGLKRGRVDDAATLGSAARPSGLSHASSSRSSEVALPKRSRYDDDDDHAAARDSRRNDVLPSASSRPAAAPRGRYASFDEAEADTAVREANSAARAAEAASRAPLRPRAASPSVGGRSDLVTHAFSRADAAAASHSGAARVDAEEEEEDAVLMRAAAELEDGEAAGGAGVSAARSSGATAAAISGSGAGGADSFAAPAVHCPLWHGCRSVDRVYKPLRKIDEGTYGVVFAARDKVTGERVALKKVKMGNVSANEGFPITALRETNVLLSLRHANIVRVREMVVGGGLDSVYMVMDYFPSDLKAYYLGMGGPAAAAAAAALPPAAGAGAMALPVATGPPFTQAEVKCLMQQLLRGVAHMHERWVIHRCVAIAGCSWLFAFFVLQSPALA